MTIACQGKGGAFVQSKGKGEGVSSLRDGIKEGLESSVGTAN